MINIENYGIQWRYDENIDSEQTILTFPVSFTTNIFVITGSDVSINKQILLNSFYNNYGSELESYKMAGIRRDNSTGILNLATQLWSRTISIGV